MYIGFGINAALLRGGIALLPDGGAWAMSEFEFTKEKVTAIAHSSGSILGIQEFVERS